MTFLFFNAIIRQLFTFITHYPRATLYLKNSAAVTNLQR